MLENIIIIIIGVIISALSPRLLPAGIVAKLGSLAGVIISIIGIVRLVLMYVQGKKVRPEVKITFDDSPKRTDTQSEEMLPASLPGIGIAPKRRPSGDESGENVK